MTVAELQLGGGASDSQALCEREEREREREREREKEKRRIIRRHFNLLWSDAGEGKRGGWVGLRRCLLRTKRQGGTQTQL